MPEMTPADTRRVLTEWRDELEAFRQEADKKGFTIFPEFVGKAEALTYALDRVWLDREEANIAATLCKSEALSLNNSTRRLTLYRVATALAGGEK